MKQNTYFLGLASLIEEDIQNLKLDIILHQSIPALFCPILPSWALQGLYEQGLQEQQRFWVTRSSRPTPPTANFLESVAEMRS